MIRLLSFFTTAVLLAITIVSCERQQVTDFIDSEYESRLSDLSDESVYEIDQATLRTGSGSGACSWDDVFPACATVTVSGSSYPKTVTVAYDACVSPGGHSRTGTLTIVLSDDLANIGATRTITYSGFGIDDFTANGTRTLTRTGTTAAGEPVFDRVVDLTWNTPRGDLDRDFSGTVTWISGFDTPACGDNVFEVSGSGTTSSDRGTVSSTILEPLRIDRPCGYITDGILQISGPLGSRSIDYGDGSCDDSATVTTADGSTFTIDLDEHRIRGRRR